MDTNLHVLEGTPNNPRKIDYNGKPAFQFLLTSTDTGTDDTPQPALVVLALVVGNLASRLARISKDAKPRAWTVVGRTETTTTQDDDGNYRTADQFVIDQICELDGWTRWETQGFHPANLAHIANPGGDLPVGVVTEAELYVDRRRLAVKPTGRTRQRVAFSTANGTVTVDPAKPVYLTPQTQQVNVKLDPDY
ncbi:hypothetical protein [Micromonospora sp. LH3U1]|uniref:hypothetical protein n=1 Tax=Micromonospora sp. LH3U1 TaxID=3018339 RepID=UPI00234A6CB0|nr:hypothetical protein [Micromonospora sp. LH3U1]WCN80029.1 hypothetical protein PCA76_24180 [Micromonospora sp. LH3U1]